MPDDDSKARVLSAAGPIFAEKGFQQATVREICQAAGVNLASVNYYFGDKETLYIEAVRQARQRRVARAPMPDWPLGTEPEVRLRDFVRTLLTRMLAGPEEAWQVRLMMREVLQPTEACRDLVHSYFRPQFELLLGILDEMLPDDMPLAKRQQIGFSVVGQCLFYRVAGEVVDMLTAEDETSESFSIDELSRHIAQFTLASLGRSLPCSRSVTSPTVGADR